MSVRYVLAPQAAIDLVEIWRYIKEQSSLEIADRVETAIREKFEFLAKTPGVGHLRKDLIWNDLSTTKNCFLSFSSSPSIKGSASRGRGGYCDG
jgi:plasmid stabilization system protein ParE